MKISLVLLSLFGSLAACHADAVRLQIKGPDGKPVAGAKVRVVEPKEEIIHYGFLPPQNLVANQAGGVAFESKHPLQKAGTKEQFIRLNQRVFVSVRSPGLAIGIAWLTAGDNTLSLQKGGTFEGVALDSDQKPIAGARLRVYALGSKAEESLAVDDSVFQATTDAQGHYRFDALPLTGEVTIGPDDAKWKSEFFKIDLAQKAPPLFLEPGIVIKGRLLKPDGTPAAGVRIASSDIHRIPTTRADGTFELIGLSETKAYLNLDYRNAPLPFLVPQKTVNDLKPGEVRNIGNWKTTRGVRARGRIVAADTQKPLVKANVQLWGHSTGAGRTDAQGFFDFAMQPGASMLSASAPDYIAITRADVPDAHNGVIQVGTIELKRGKKASGTLLDDKGNPVLALDIRASKPNSNTGGDAWGDVGADGRFSLSGLDEGEYTIRIQGFKILSGARFSVGAKGTTPASLRVVVASKGNAATSTTGTTSQIPPVITGRVETADGTGIGGAKIGLRFTLAETFSMPLSALSQSDGSFSVPIPQFQLGQIKVSPTLKVVSVYRPGFILGANQVVSENGNLPTIIKMQTKGQMLRGRIVDANGQGVARAFVALSDSTALPVAADTNGNFALADAPLEGVTLLASNGPSFALFDVTAGHKVEIALPAGPSEPDKIAVANTLVQSAVLNWEWKDDWNTLGPQRVEAIMKARGIAEGGGNWSWSQYLEELARREPQTFLARESELRATTPDPALPTFERVLMLSRAKAGTDEQKVGVHDWLEQQENAKRDITSETAEQLIQLAEVAAALDAKNGTMWLDYAGQIADQLPDNGGDRAWNWGAMVARAQKDASITFGDGWKPTIQLMLLDSAMEFYLQTNDLENARRAYEQSQQVAAEADKNPDNDRKPKPYGLRAGDLLRQTTASYAQLLARTDPASALALAPAIDEYDRAKLFNAVARRATDLKQFDVAKKAIEATFQLPIGNSKFLAEAASIAQEFDPTYVATVWPRVYARAYPPQGDESPARYSIAFYAAARAAEHPGESRVLLEREWQKRLQKAAQQTPEDQESEIDEGNTPMRGLVEAMAKVSPARALEMLPRLTQRQNVRAQAQTQIAVTLLSK